MDWRSFQRDLLQWFDASHRNLPWRKTKDPYAVWVSEIMLQQTQVATVIPYYERFLARFPTPSDLATADEQEVLRLWEGLGYYRRARSLHRAAQEIVGRFDGRFPEQFDQVHSLPGIGRYTAGAILSIALNQPTPILEGNTIRVHSRMHRVEDDINRSATQKRLWDLASQAVDPDRSGDMNQALMELGSEVCKPRSPGCSHCPVRRHCAMSSAEEVESLPYNATKEKLTAVHEAVVLVRRRGKLLLRQCQPGERWAGLWDFPRYAHNPEQVEAQLEKAVLKQTGLNVSSRNTGWSIRHGVTRYRIQLSCYVADEVSGRLVQRSNSLRWFDPHELEELPLSVTARKVARAMPDFWDPVS